MNLPLRILLFFILSVYCISAGAQGTSSKGTEFWTTWMDHRNKAVATGGVTPSQMVLYITSDVNTSGQVDFDGSTVPFNVIANQVNLVQVTVSEFLNSTTDILRGKGIHITALKPVAVYAHIYATSVSGATLLLPVASLGKNYTSINYTQTDATRAPVGIPAFSVFDIIATEDNTSVEITPTQDLTGGPHPAGTPYIITLSKGDVYQGESALDLTGTKIRSVSVDNNTCKPIAVFSGSSKLSISATSSGDNLFQQVYPTATWGKNFITVPLLNRPFDIFRVIFTDPNTTVTGLPVAVTPADLAKGYVEFRSTVPLVISADKPIQAVQYAITQMGEDGDPEMIYLNPIEQGLDHITVYSSGRYRINKSYINVVIPTANASSFKLDGGALPAGASFVQIAGTIYSYAQIPVTSGPQETQPSAPDNGTHNLSANTIFSAIAYGFGPTESYGYSAGTNLKNLNEFITFQDPATNNRIITSGCSNVAYTPKLTIPFRITSIKWVIDGGTPVVQTTNLNEQQTTTNNQVTYTYSYYDATKNSSAINFAAGDHTTIATIFNPTGDCGTNEDIDPGPISILDSPIPAITASPSCVAQATSFALGTATDVSTIAAYSWDFGDRTAPSTDASPTHTYAITGDYKVVLTLTYASGCSNSSQQLAVHVSPKPIANFKFSNPDCAGGVVTFTDISTYPERRAATYNWDFGDGATSGEQNPKHIFSAANSTGYNVLLTITNDLGCIGTFNTPVVIHETPVAGFTAPDICLKDGIVQFTNTSDYKGDPQTGFIYSWNFGDPGSATNTSSLANPTHAYTVANVYTVTLTITSQYGCPATISKQIIVNASDPAAGFTVSNLNALCAASPVVFQDITTKATQDVITKVVWHWGDGSTAETYDKTTIHADKIYTHNYALSSATPLNKQFTVTLDEYTGLTCVSTAMQQITVYANPVVKLTAPGEICQEASPVQVLEATNFTGKGVFTGDGISATGLFDPYKAGPGTHTINYLFTDKITGCTYSDAVTIIVDPTPVITLGPDIKILEGDTTKLVATVTGDGLTYQWYPSTGLNRDDILNPIANPSDDTRYTLKAASAKGCTSTASMNIIVLKMPKVPNTFTPNGDGINDYWVIDQLSKYANATVEVFSRNGDKIYSSKGYAVPWDGKFNGADLPVGVYYYIINPKEGRKTMSGYVTIIR